MLIRYKACVVRLMDRREVKICLRNDRTLDGGYKGSS